MPDLRATLKSGSPSPTGQQLRPQSVSPSSAPLWGFNQFTGKEQQDRDQSTCVRGAKSTRLRRAHESEVFLAATRCLRSRGLDALLRGSRTSSSAGMKGYRGDLCCGVARVARLAGASSWSGFLAACGTLRQAGATIFRSSQCCQSFDAMLPSVGFRLQGYRSMQPNITVGAEFRRIEILAHFRIGLLSQAHGHQKTKVLYGYSALLHAHLATDSRPPCGSR